MPAIRAAVVVDRMRQPRLPGEDGGNSSIAVLWRDFFPARVSQGKFARMGRVVPSSRGRSRWGSAVNPHAVKVGSATLDAARPRRAVQHQYRSANPVRSRDGLDQHAPEKDGLSLADSTSTGLMYFDTVRTAEGVHVIRCGRFRDLSGSCIEQALTSYGL